MSRRCEWLVILPDHPNALGKRMEVRQQHLDGMKTLAETEEWTMGGATLETAPKEGEPMSLNGSVMIAVADSKEEVMAKLRKDVYATSGVWNMNEVRRPYLPDFRL